MNSFHLVLGYNPTVNTNSFTSDIGWLWTLRLYAAGAATLDGTEDASPQHLRMLLSQHIGNTIDDKSEIKLDFMTIVAEELAKYEAKKPSIYGNIAINLRRLGDRFRLNTIEREILAFRVVFRLHGGLEVTINKCVGYQWLEPVLFRTLSAALKRSEKEVEDALLPNGKLCGSGLLTLARGLEKKFESKLMILPGLISALNRPFKTVDAMLGFVITKAPRADLSTTAFPHHKDEINLILGHLAQSSQNRCKGVNILLHGKPGVGKTELARAFARELAMKAYEVSTNPGQTHDEIFGWLHARFRGFMLLQNMLRFGKNGLVIFDEIEDVLPKPKLLERPGFDDKAWLNQLVENNPVPAIWISNEVWHLDPALVRRFDIVLEVKVPTRSKRKELLECEFKGLPVESRWLEKKAGETDLTPAITKRALRVIRSSGLREATDVQSSFDSQMNERRSALNLIVGDAYPEPREYRLDWLNTSTDMVSVASSLASTGRGRILLFGPPGSGKTAFAHYLSKQADRPLMLKRASDLMSMWLGETEKNLHEMFVEATRDEAILLLDEADSFLQDRRGAQRSWELTQVNELLTRMENFQGLFICATNFMEHLDPAAMRRFTFKIKFDYLRLEQTEILFQETIQQLGGSTPDGFSRQKYHHVLARLRNLTPGDFSAAADRFAVINKVPTPAELLEELTQNSEIKNGGKSIQMGFAA